MDDYELTRYMDTPLTDWPAGVEPVRGAATTRASSGRWQGPVDSPGGIHSKRGEMSTGPRP